MRHTTAIIMILGSTLLAACSGEMISREPREPQSALASDGATLRSNKESLARSLEPGRRYEAEQRWELSDPIAVKALQGTPFGEQEITEFWTRKGWRLTKHEERYMAQIDQLIAEGKLTKAGHWAQTPFNDVYKTAGAVNVDGVSIPAGTEFWMEFCENEDEIKQGRPLFARSPGYVEEHQGHTDQASDAHPGELRAGRERHE